MYFILVKFVRALLDTLDAFRFFPTFLEAFLLILDCILFVNILPFINYCHFSLSQRLPIRSNPSNFPTLIVYSLLKMLFYSRK